MMFVVAALHLQVILLLCLNSLEVADGAATANHRTSESLHLQVIIIITIDGASCVILLNIL